MCACLQHIIFFIHKTFKFFDSIYYNIYIAPIIKGLTLLWMSASPGTAFDQLHEAQTLTRSKKSFLVLTGSGSHNLHFFGHLHWQKPHGLVLHV